MMRLNRIVIVALSLISLVLLATAWSQEDIEAVSNMDFERPQRSPALFMHDTHNETAGIDECSVCHHVYEDGQRVEDESSEDQRCADCHGLAANDDQPGLMQAFHGNCRGCHVQRKQGPAMCGECHLR